MILKFTINTDRENKTTRPEIVIIDMKCGILFGIDMAVPTDRNISLKVFKNNYQNTNNLKKFSQIFDARSQYFRLWHLG